MSNWLVNRRRVYKVKNYSMVVDGGCDIGGFSPRAVLSCLVWKRGVFIYGVMSNGGYDLHSHVPHVAYDSAFWSDALLRFYYPTNEVMFSSRSVCLCAKYLMKLSTDFDDIFKEECLCARDKLISWTQRWNRVSGSRVTGSAILAGSGRVTGHCVRPGVDPVLSFNTVVYRGVVFTE